MKNKKVLVIAAHPDDEVLGCGATLSKLSKKNCNIRVIFLSDGETSRVNSKKKANKIGKEIKQRQTQAKQAAKILGIKSIKFFKFPDNKLDKIEQIKINKIIEKEIELFKPNIIFTHSNHDLNVDHIAVHNSTITACRPYKFKFIESIYAFEIASSTESNFKINKNKFSPNVFVDIRKEIKVKIKALSFYKKEIMQWPHPRSLKAVKILSNYRGFQSGFENAEAFHLVRGKIILI